RVLVGHARPPRHPGLRRYHDPQVAHQPIRSAAPPATLRGGAAANVAYSVCVSVRTWSSSAWLYWRSICSSVCSFLISSSRCAISARSLSSTDSPPTRAAGDAVGAGVSAPACGQVDSPCRDSAGGGTLIGPAPIGVMRAAGATGAAKRLLSDGIAMGWSAASVLG